MIEPTGAENATAPTQSGPAPPPPSVTPPPAEGTKALTADEQMAIYEQDLKEHDWGHQPC